MFLTGHNSPSATWAVHSPVRPLTSLAGSAQIVYTHKSPPERCLESHLWQPSSVHFGVYILFRVRSAALAREVCLDGIMNDEEKKKPCRDAVWGTRWESGSPPAHRGEKWAFWQKEPNHLSGYFKSPIFIQRYEFLSDVYHTQSICFFSLLI